jgi:isopenicillin-N N-acyltransferase like protein
MMSYRFARKAVSVAACLLLAGIITPHLFAATIEAQKSDVRPPFSPAFVVEGAPRERGIAYGKQFRDGIRTFLAQEIYDALSGKPSSKEELLRYAAACGKATREVCPMVAEEIEGIAEGAGLSYGEIVLIHLHEEVYQGRKLPTGYEGHCTAVAVSPQDSGDGRTYVGQTWDWMTRLAGVSSVTEWRRDDAASVLAYGYPGMPIGAGMNSQGIALCWTSGVLKKDDKTSPRVGVPAYAMITHLLAQRDIESVIREAKRDKHAGWFTFVMADADGNLVNIEGSPRGVEIERSSDRLARHGFGTRTMTEAKPGQAVELQPLCQQMYKLLEQTAGKNDRKTLERYLTGREHGIMGWKSPTNKTIDVLMFDTSTRKAYFSRGPEYGLEWREFGFHDSKQ